MADNDSKSHTHSPETPETLVKDCGGMPPTKTPEQIWAQNQPPAEYAKPPITDGSMSGDGK